MHVPCSLYSVLFRPMHSIYINKEFLYRTPTCFDAFASSSGSLILYLLNLQTILIFLISNFRRVLNISCFLLGSSPASELYMPTFRNTLFHLFLLASAIFESNLFRYKYPYCSLLQSHFIPPACEDGTECSETSAYIIQTPGNYPKENIIYVLILLL